MSSYREWIQNSRIRNVAESIQSGLQLARAEAVKRNTPVQFALGSGSEWAVGCVTATAECPAIIQSRSANEGSSSGITLDVVPAGKTTVVMNNLGTVNISPVPFTQITVDVSTTVLPAADSRELRVMLGVGGHTRLCDPNLASTDLRAC